MRRFPQRPALNLELHVAQLHHQVFGRRFYQRVVLFCSQDDHRCGAIWFARTVNFSVELVIEDAVGFQMFWYQERGYLNFTWNVAEGDFTHAYFDGVWTGCCKTYMPWANLAHCHTLLINKSGKSIVVLYLVLSKEKSTW